MNLTTFIRLLEAERAVEKSKNNLITNVSHDLKKSLTSIIVILLS